MFCFVKMKRTSCVTMMTSIIIPQMIIKACRYLRFAKKYLFAFAKTSNPKSQTQSMSSYTGSTPPTIARRRLIKIAITAAILNPNWIQIYYDYGFLLFIHKQHLRHLTIYSWSYQSFLYFHFRHQRSSYETIFTVYS